MTGRAFEPYAPLNVPKPVADGLWVVDGPEIRLSMLGLKVPFPTRMTVARLPDGGLWIHSPIAPDEQMFAATLALGPVRAIVAPNTLHYWWLPEWHARCLDAGIYACSDLAASARRPLPSFETLGSTPPSAWSGSFEQVVIAGDFLTEVAFLHRASRTLILADLIENFETERIRPRWLRWTVLLGGAADPDGKAPIDMRLGFLRRRKAMRAAVRQMLAWQPQRIIIAHGRWYERNGTAELRRAFRWVL
jgi:hypothetical protein